MPFPIFKFLHIATVFLGVTLSVGGELFGHGIIKSGEVRAIRVYGKQFQPFGMITPIVFVVGMLFGLLAAYFGQFNFFQTWLLLAYALFVILNILGGLNGAYFGRVTQAAMASPDDAPSSELKAMMANRNPWYMTVASMVGFVLFIFVMVFKPFS